MADRPAQIRQIMETGPDPQTPSGLLPLVYEELRQLARAKLAREAPGQTLQATALVHEAYLRLLSNDEQRWSNRGHFFAAAAEAMRRILIERARRRASGKHGGDWQRITLSGLAEDTPEKTDLRILALDKAIAELEETAPLRARIVKLRFFVGLTIEETAQALEISAATVRRHWAVTRARLAYRIKGEEI